ncbi:AAA family ATPase [Geminicoccus roseus]|uniref:AAA family ATPase n=1 Tax=Geminicoccus roseus TaxID=404900 RepID=UPI000401C515|nr:AAA family ATPase [Geminicoccus roseus]
MDLPGHMLELLQDEDELVLFRARRRHGDGSVLLRMPAADLPGPAALARIEHEHGLADLLDPAWAVRPLEIVRPDGRVMLLLEDPSGEPLRSAGSRPMELGAALEIAAGAAACLARLHQVGLVHQDVRPAHLMADAARQVRLTGFGIATRLPRVRQPLLPVQTIVGSFPFMAPEQTGRMNRSVDGRSDLYALGVALYQMLTGTLPFTASEPLEWIHAHVAMPPPPPCQRNPGLPPMVGAIVLRLLAKAAEDRYQTAAGLEADLRRCLAEWRALGRIELFPQGGQDVPDRLLVPGELYGRARETAALAASFARVARLGRTELVLVSGYAGIGKSSMVAELHKTMLASQGLFASGKFDQHARMVPYATLAPAFQGLIRQILGGSDAELEAWRGKLQAALGSHGRLLLGLIPELELVTGPQPPLPEVPPQEAKQRFHKLFVQFVGVFARPEHPLVLFLDDLQWLDPATLDLVELLATDPQVRHLLLVGAYRDNEVGPDHPLAARLEAIRAAGAPVVELVLGPLAPSDMARLLADTLRVPVGRAWPLARLVLAKTGGNPFFTIQFLGTLAEDGLLLFDPQARAWGWDLERIRAKDLTENVVELMAARLSRLAEPGLGVVRILACLGNRASAPVLALASGRPEAEVRAALGEALAAGLVVPAGEGWAFLHDRVQEAAYGLVPPAERPALHLRIGRILAARLGGAPGSEFIFEIVGQLDRALELITDPEERERVAALNLAAAGRARAATAFGSAAAYLQAGQRLLPDEAWQRCPGLAFDIELQLAECEFLTGDLARSERRLAALAARELGPLDRAAVAWLQITSFTAQGRFDQAVETCLAHLRGAGIAWQAHPTRAEVLAEYAPIRRQIEADAIGDYAGLPLLTDPSVRAKLDVLTAVLPPAFFTDQNLVCLVLCRMVNLSRENGLTDASCLAMAYLGMVLGPQFGAYQAGYRFGRTGFDLVAARGLTRFEPRVTMCFAYHVLPWTRPMREGRPWLRQAFERAEEAGDLTYAGFSSCTLISNMLAAGDPLGEVQREAERKLAYVVRAKFGLIADIITTQLHLVRSLRGLTPVLGSFDDGPIFEEAAFERHLEADPGLCIAACWYWIRKLQARCVAGDVAGALAAAERAEPLLWTTGGHLELVEFHVHAALARAAWFRQAPPERRAALRQELGRHAAQLASWAEHAPENFRHRSLLVAGEIARLDGQGLDALRLFEQAMAEARTHAFPQVEALAAEAAARCCQAEAMPAMALAFLQLARDAYRRLGAEGKVRQLDHAMPGAAARSAAPAARPASPVEQLDLATILKSAQAIAGEAVLTRLIDKLMVIALEHAGADRGLLVVPRADQLWIEAEARTVQGAVDVQCRRSLLGPADAPPSVLHYAIRTRDSVLLDDALTSPPFAEDAYIRQRRCRSVLCIPLVRQAQLTGLLYLENSQAPHVFTPTRGALLKLLASQAALSLENAELEEKEALLKEVHHRVKNNLQLVSSLLSLQASHVDDPAVAELFTDSRNRVRSLALVHENLYRAGNFARIAMDEHIKSLCAHILRAYGSRGQQIELSTRVDDLQLDLDRAVPCGLIVNELVSNALKHAFPDRRSGQVQVEMRLLAGRRCRLSVADDGVGMPADPARSDTLGLQLVHDLVQQLRGEIEVQRDHGTRFTIDFDLEGHRLDGRRPDGPGELPQ